MTEAAIEALITHWNDESVGDGAVLEDGANLEDGADLEDDSDSLELTPDWDTAASLDETVAELELQNLVQALTEDAAGDRRTARIRDFSRDRLPDEISDRTSDSPSDWTGDRIPDASSDWTGDRIPDASSDWTGDRTSDSPSDWVGDRTSDSPSDWTGDRTPDSPSDWVGDRTPDSPSNRIADRTPDSPRDRLESEVAEGAEVIAALSDPSRGSEQTGRSRDDDRGWGAEESQLPQGWYLGLDIGTSGISAVLLNRPHLQLYPLYWTETASQEGSSETEGGQPQTFRLSCTVAIAATPQTPEFLLQSFKPLLKLGIPHYSPATSRWEPILQWADNLQVPMSWIHQALQGLLATLNAGSASETTRLNCGAVGLEPRLFHRIMRNLTGVMVGYPANWSDTYSLNVREAILGARLVAQPDQIFFVEDAIASLLSTLRTADRQDLHLPQHPGQDAHLHNADWQGETLILQAGAATTELLFVYLPQQLQSLTHEQFHCRSLAYGGQGIDQDIICQLLLNEGEEGWVNPARQREARQRDGRVDLDLGDLDLGSLYLNDLLFPAPGEPDLGQRYRLQQRLLSLPTGRKLLEAAQYLKMVLQQQHRFTLKVGDRQRTILRQDLASLVILPYVQRLNRELNALLTQTGTPVLAVQQVICSGGTASLGAIARWLRQKLPNATIIQDTYDVPASLEEMSLSSCSRVAYGLAVLPFYASVIDQARHRYSDYFLLQELLRVFPNHPVTVAEIMLLMEHQGIDTQLCHSHILALLEGHLPPGFMPSEQEALLLTPESRANPDYRAVQLAPLFSKQPDQTYRPNRHQWNYLRSYLDSLLATTHQKLTEPLGLPQELLERRSV